MTRRYELKQRAQRQADTRRRILEATVELHVERGLVATQITDIAQRAGVDRRLLALQRDAAQVLASGWSPADQHQPALAATIRVAVDFRTWQCLVGERGLSEQAAVELAVTWTRCLTSPR